MWRNLLSKLGIGKKEEASDAPLFSSEPKPLLEIVVFEDGAWVCLDYNTEIPDAYSGTEANKYIAKQKAFDFVFDKLKQARGKVHTEPYTQLVSQDPKGLNDG